MYRVKGSREDSVKQELQWARRKHVEQLGAV